MHAEAVSGQAAECLNDLTKTTPVLVRVALTLLS